jgi:hypothetical protein
VVTVLYFIIAGCLMQVLDYVERRTSPRRLEPEAVR